jgi:hypothetical protein
MLFVNNKKAIFLKKEPINSFDILTINASNFLKNE